MSQAMQYLCPAELVAMIEHKNLSLDALRVFHALCYFTDQHPTFQITSMASPSQRSAHILSRKLTACTFPPSTNDLRPVRATMQALQAAGLVEVFNFSDTNRDVRFRFSRRVIESITARRKDGQFAMMEPGMLSQLSSAAHVLFYTRVVMHQGANVPIFYIPGINPQTAPWSQMRRRWIRAACKLSRIYGHGYLFCPEVDFASTAVIRMRVKITHPETTWYPGRLYHRIADKPPVAVFAGKAESLTREEMRARESWTQVQAIR